MNRAYKFRLYPNKGQKELLDKTFGCCRFVYNKMLEERKTIYQELKENRKELYNHKYKTEKEFKEEHSFLKEVDAKALQSEWRHLSSAYQNFFKNIKERRQKKTIRYVGYPKFKSKKNRQSYTTYNINNNCKIDFKKKILKLPKIRTWIKFRDDRVFIEKIRHITVSKSRSDKYFASILIEIDNTISPKQILEENKIIGFDMSASKFLITKEFELSSPRFYRKMESKLKRYHREVSKKKKGSKNRNRTRIELAKEYEKIANRKRDWIHKTTHLLSKHFDCVVLENLNIEGMKQFNSGVSKSITLDFSWYQFVSILRYKMESKGKHLILIGRYFPSSKLCSQCGFKNLELKLSDKKWTCPECNKHHYRDINASVNIKTEGLKILEENDITIIYNNDKAVGTTVSAFGDDVRLMLSQQFSMNYESNTFW